MYAGFLVVRRSCKAPDFHYDWVGGGNEAFTLITPISLPAPEFGLLYHRLDGKIGDYAYTPGEAIVIGDNFSHSTKPAQFDAPVALLSFTFGTDRMDRWDSLALTAAKQAGLIRRPDGEFVRCEVRLRPASRLLTGA